LSRIESPGGEGEGTAAAVTVSKAARVVRVRRRVMDLIVGGRLQ
jgi:hypothetical protein